MDLNVGRPLTPARIAELLAEARSRTLLLTASLSDEALRVQHDPLMSPIVWDLGHIGHFEDVWLRENLREGGGGSEGLRGIYNPFENPRSTRDSLPLPTLPECRQYLADIRRAVFQELDDLPADTAERPLLHDGFVFRMVLQHEYQHNETMLQTLQLKKGDPYLPPRQLSPPKPDPDAPPPGATVRFPGGRVRIGTNDRSVAYDNERPAHEVELEPFAMDVHPVTNGAFLKFVRDGGYDERDHWSEAGWSWRSEQDLEAPKYWVREGEEWTERSMDRIEALDPLRPVCHVGYWEADAYARWAGARLPTEAEWETAAGWDPERRVASPYPWGCDPPTARHANLDALVFQTTPVGAYPLGRSALGCWDMLGNVWEWTSSDFNGYPGYRTFPYPEYSEAFFGDEYKVLRGGSWATRFGAIRNTFRNWDYPIRRQIFSGFRCARDG